MVNTPEAPAFAERLQALDERLSQRFIMSCLRVSFARSLIRALFCTSPPTGPHAPPMVPHFHPSPHGDLLPIAGLDPLPGDG